MEQDLTQIRTALAEGKTVTLAVTGIDARRNRGNMPSVEAGGEAYVILRPTYDRDAARPTEVEVTTLVPDRHAPFDFAPGTITRTTIGQFGLTVTETGISLHDDGKLRRGPKPPFALRNVPLLDADITVAAFETRYGSISAVADHVKSTIEARERSEARAASGERVYTGFER